MNPVTFVSAMTALWMMIPEERRDQYAHDLLDLIEDLAADARDALKSKIEEENENE